MNKDKYTNTEFIHKSAVLPNTVLAEGARLDIRIR